MVEMMDEQYAPWFDPKHPLNIRPLPPGISIHQLFRLTCDEKNPAEHKEVKSLLYQSQGSGPNVDSGIYFDGQFYVGRNLDKILGLPGQRLQYAISRDSETRSRYYTWQSDRWVYDGFSVDPTQSYLLI